MDQRWIDDLESTNVNTLIDQNTIIESTTNLNTNESDIESNYDEEDEYEDDEDDDDDDDEVYYDDNTSNMNYPSYLDTNNSNINNNNNNNSNFVLNSVGLRKKKSHKEAGLWWDEDEALNELTSSMSFDFTNHIDRNEDDSNINNNNNNNNNDMYTLKRLEKILNNSDLFSNEIMNENVANLDNLSNGSIKTSSSSNKIILNNKNENQMFKRLSLA
jgi:hypothetical protein